MEAQWKPKKKNLHVVNESTLQSSGTESDEDFLVLVLRVEGESPAYRVTPLLEGRPTRMEVDTGAAVSLISQTVFQEHLKHLPITAADVKLRTYTGETVPMLGKVIIHVELNGQTAKLPAYVAKVNFPCL